MILSEVLSHANVIRQEADPELPILGLAYDSRQVQPGWLFAAVPGFKADGHHFIAQARAAGAAAVLTERWIPDAGLPQVQTDIVRRTMALAAANFYGHPSRQLKLVGVTGTNGKTTTTYLIDSILRSSGSTTGLLGGIEYRIGSATLPAQRTTPESVDLQRMLREMVEAGVDTATLEVSSHGIDLYRVAYLDFDVAVFTNLTREHLDLHAGMEEYYQAKRRLFTGELENGPSAPDSQRPRAVINVDDEYGRRLAGELAGPVRFGTAADADIRAAGIRARGWQTDFKLATPAGTAPVNLKLPGDYNLSNALAAAGAGFALGIGAEVISAGLGACSGPPGRFELVDVAAPFSVVIDYAHNEDGLAKSLALARSLTKNRLIVVFGCPGERDREKRPQMGRIAGSLADLAILTTDDCYGEPPARILDETEPGLQESGGEYLRIRDRREAIEAAIESAVRGDTVLIAGKGHETKQIMASGALPFSDKEIVTQMINITPG